MTRVRRRVLLRQIVLDHRNPERRLPRLRRRHPQRRQRRRQAAPRVARYRHPGRPQAPLRPPRRHPQRTPERRRPPVQTVLPRHRVALRRQRHQRRLDLDRTVRRRQFGRDLAARPRPVEQRQEVGVEPPVERPVEGLRDQQHGVLAHRARLQVRRQQRALDQPAVGLGDPEQRLRRTRRAVEQAPPGRPGRGLVHRTRIHERTPRETIRRSGGATGAYDRDFKRQAALRSRLRRRQPWRSQANGAGISNRDTTEPSFGKTRSSRSGTIGH